MTADWPHASPAILAAFLASLVEFIEAMTIVLAVGAVRGWRGAIGGASLALVLLAVLTALLGPVLIAIPLGWVHLVLGTLLILFGLRWLRKAILRAAGVIPLHDETAAYQRQTRALQTAGGVLGGWDRLAVATSFKITLIEGIEVVFIVVAVGTSGRGLIGPAVLGAVAALLVVIALGAAFHKPVSMVPENSLKFIVGVLLSAFGTFWFGEGMGWQWPGADWSLLGLNGIYVTAALVAVLLCRQEKKAR